MKIEINKIENEQRKNNTAKSSILIKLIKSINPIKTI